MKNRNPEYLIGRNRGLFNGLTDFYRQNNSHQQGLNLYKLIQQYYKHCFTAYKASLINSKWAEVLEAIGRLIEQIKKLEISEQYSTGQGKNNISLNLSVCSFNSSGTDNSLRTSQKEVLEASQLFFQFLSEKNRNEIISLLSFLRICSCSSGPLSIEGILLDYSNIIFSCVNWDSKKYNISQLNEVYSYDQQIMNLWVENFEVLGGLPEELGRQIKLKCELIRKGELSEYASDYKFCHSITRSEYNNQSEQGTQNELFNLLKDIENSNMPQRKKDKLIEQFRTTHRLY